MKPITIDYKKCIGCRRCYDLCPQDIYVIDETTKLPMIAPQREGECWFCGICWMECPKRAIDIRLPASLW